MKILFENQLVYTSSQTTAEAQAQPQQAQTPTEVEGTGALTCVSRHGGFPTYLSGTPIWKCITHILLLCSIYTSGWVYVLPAPLVKRYCWRLHRRHCRHRRCRSHRHRLRHCLCRWPSQCHRHCYHCCSRQHCHILRYGVTHVFRVYMYIVIFLSVSRQVST